MNIAENYKKIRNNVPENVSIVVAAKTRTPEELEEVINAGATDIGENYVQEAEYAKKGLPAGKFARVRWHMIGSMQKNKINKALELFDVIQTVDSIELAEAINKRAERVIPVYIEVNISGGKSKRGVEPGRAAELISSISGFEHIRINGLMAMEPYCIDPKDARPYFKKMKTLFENIKMLNMPNVDMQVLSMGMTNSYKVAIEEGANMVRTGTAIFGERG